MWKEMNQLPEDQKQALSVLLMDYASFGMADLVGDSPAQWLRDPAQQPAKAAPAPAAQPQKPAGQVTSLKAAVTENMAARLQKQESPAATKPVAQPSVQVDAKLESESAEVLFMLTGEISALSAAEVSIMTKIAQHLVPDVEPGYITVTPTSRHDLQKEKVAPLLEKSASKYVLVWGQEAVNALHGDEILLREAAKERQVNGKTCLYFYHPRTILRQGNLKKMAWHEVLSALA